MYLDKFTSKFTDFLRPNLFAVYIYPKAKFENNYTEEGINLLCHEASIPFHTFTTVDVFYNNKTHSTINKIDYDPISFTFYVDKFNKVLNFFDEWKKQIINENFQFGFYDDYISQIYIHVFDKLGEIAVSTVIEEAYPVNINPITLSYGENDVIMNLQTSFKFKEIKHFYFDRTKQQGPMEWIKENQNQFNLGTARNLVNMVEKMKNLAYMVKNGNVYDAISQGGNFYNSILKNAKQGGIVDQSMDMVNKAKKSF